MSNDEKKQHDPDQRQPDQETAKEEGAESAVDTAAGSDDEQQEQPAIEASYEEVPEEPAREDGGNGTRTVTDGAPGAGRRWGIAALMTALIALLLAVGVAGLGHYRARQIEQALGTLPPAIERNADRIAGNQQQVAELAGTLQEQGTAITSQVDALEETITALREQMGRDQSGWILAEAEYLLLVANHRLRLEGDVDTALAALQIADERLRETGDPALIGIREKIAAESSALKTLSRPDLTGLALSLMGLADQVDKLPLQNTYLAVAPSSSERETGVREVENWRELAGAVWGDLKGLVTVRRREEALEPMLAPEQQYFLRQNLRLQLDSARLALLRADQPQLDRALQAAREWIPRYFDPRAAATQGMLSELERIAEVEIRPELPDISGSLKALRARMRDVAERE